MLSFRDLQYGIPYDFIRHAVDPHIHYHRAFFYPLPLDQAGPAYGDTGATFARFQDLVSPAGTGGNYTLTAGSDGSLSLTPDVSP